MTTTEQEIDFTSTDRWREIYKGAVPTRAEALEIFDCWQSGLCTGDLKDYDETGVMGRVQYAIRAEIVWKPDGVFFHTRASSRLWKAEQKAEKKAEG